MSGVVTVPALSYLPVALVTRLPDGQLVVLHGQSGEVETSADVTHASDGYRTTIEWRPGRFTQSRLPDSCPGVKLHDDSGPGGMLFHPTPLHQGVDAETRATQLENALRALLDAIDDPSGTEVGVELAADEARALLDGEGAPADTEDPDA